MFESEMDLSYLIPLEAFILQKARANFYSCKAHSDYILLKLIPKVITIS